MQDENGGLSSQLASALSADARGKAALSAAQDRFATSMATTDLALAADASVLKDALASEKTVAAALDPSAVAPTADAGGDVDSLTAAAGFSPLHAAALHSSHSTAHATLQAEVRSPMGTQAWADEVGGHLTWMASHGRESASLTLTPEHLGPIEVRITTQDGQTSVWFGAQNADTRSAIEQALPRLRELFSSQGLSLADSGVFREAPRQQPQNFSDAANGSSNGEAAAVVTSVAKRGNGILDLYA
jgi:flagellar hook-length control protein FliK